MIQLLTTALAPGIALLTYFYLRNDYETQMVGQVSRAFIIGALLVFPIMVIQYALDAEGVITKPISRAFVSAAFLEEFVQWFLLFFIAYRYGTFRTKYDGIVYGVSLSLGFATAENLLYLVAHGMEGALGRALLPVSSHALFGVVMGFYFSCARYRVYARQQTWLILAFIIPFILHGLYDLILLTIHQYVVVIIIPFMMFLWWFALRHVKKANGNVV